MLQWKQMHIQNGPRSASARLYMKYERQSYAVGVTFGDADEHKVLLEEPPRDEACRHHHSGLENGVVRTDVWSDPLTRGRVYKQRSRYCLVITWGVNEAQWSSHTTTTTTRERRSEAGRGHVQCLSDWRWSFAEEDHHTCINLLATFFIALFSLLLV